MNASNMHTEKKKSVNKRTLTYNSYCTNHSPAVHGSSISYNMEQDGNVTSYKGNESKYIELKITNEWSI